MGSDSFNKEYIFYILIPIIIALLIGFPNVYKILFIVCFLFIVASLFIYSLHDVALINIEYQNGSKQQLLTSGLDINSVLTNVNVKHVEMQYFSKLGAQNKKVTIPTTAWENFITQIS